jgi:hypothetical protein
MGTRGVGRAPAHAAWTLATWRVIEGREAAFVEAWTAFGRVLSGLSEPPIWGLLLQNQHDPRVFSSFGPWRNFHEIDIMRKDASVQEAFQRLVDCCHEAEAGTFRLTARVDARGHRALENDPQMDADRFDPQMNADCLIRG